MGKTILTPTWAFDSSDIPDPDGRAEKMVRFARILRHPKSEAPGGRLVLTRWQERIIRRIYGPSTEDGRRQVRTVFLLVPRGNRKTTLGAVLALGHTIGPAQDRSGQVISAASDRSQARIAFDEAAEFVRLDPVLLGAAKIRDTKNRIEHPKSRSVYTAISADGDAQHGKTPSFVLADEIHIWRGFDLYSALKTGLAKVPGSLLVITTTMGPEEGVNPLFDDLYTYAHAVASGAVDDPSFLPILFEVPPEAPWDAEETWKLANPGLVEGGFPDLPSLRDEARQAKEIPRLRIDFERLHLNRRPKTGSMGGLVDMEAFDDGAAPIDLEALEGLPCWIGVDMSRTYDLTAVVAAFRTDAGGYIVLPFPFIPEAMIARRAAETDLPWRRWQADGHLTAIPGAIIDDDVIEAKIRELVDRFDVQEVAFDPKFAGKLIARLVEDGVPCVEFPPKLVTVGPAYAGLQRAIIGRRFQHGNHPVLRWNVASAAVVTGDTGLPFVTKKKSRAAVDVLVAAAMAVGRASAAGTPVVDFWDAPNFKPEDAIFSWS